MKYKCVFADLDKTLLGENARISDFTKKTLEALLKMGVDFVPCSGRALLSFPPQIFEIQGIKYGISSNGVSIDNLQTKKSISNLKLPTDFPQQIFNRLKDFQARFECYMDGQAYTQKDFFCNPWILNCKTFNPDYIERTRIPKDDLKDFIIQNKNNIDAVSIIMHPDGLDKLFPMLKKEFNQVYMTHSENYLVECSNVESGKHNGIKRFCQMKGYSIEETIAFGDGNNDVEMLQTVGLPIAVDNATDVCKKIAKRFCESNIDDGVAKEIRRIFGMKDF